ncbi:hypothetical protein ACP4OV_005730 [Aristida adscensionis]
METIFRKVNGTNAGTEIFLRVSFIEIFKEEVYDLLDASHANSGSVAKASGLARVPIQIRETAHDGITLPGVTEAEVKSKEEMASYLVRGSLSCATGTECFRSSF